MRISDWSSDVCSSDLVRARLPPHQLNRTSHDEAAQSRQGRRKREGKEGQAKRGGEAAPRRGQRQDDRQAAVRPRSRPRPSPEMAAENGRASCRESVCQYVSISVVAVSLKKKRAKTRKK